MNENKAYLNVFNRIISIKLIQLHSFLFNINGLLIRVSLVRAQVEEPNSY
jgi:hypothetical protein